MRTRPRPIIRRFGQSGPHRIPGDVSTNPLEFFDTPAKAVMKSGRASALREARAMPVAALDALRAELAAKGAPVKDGSWGYRLLVVDDPGGNQLFFNYPAEIAYGKNL